MSRLLPVLFLMLFGLLVLNATSGMATSAGCHGGDHAQTVAQTTLDCKMEHSHHANPCGVAGPCATLSCMVLVVGYTPQQSGLSASGSIVGWTRDGLLQGRMVPPPIKPPRAQA